ncbi:cytochrome d ubiquinol oxidase subunit II [Thermosulfidibacter takaii ABI70S6]|uniref:Cytochrome d ubiquinol oxidase subunit II n=1 Tax=Thermosulfidibacter takaii (strain DSM 17441 / JCM 13301 / NBRC 103674 / ABI70S6) TaxID=1298851 RepID=A0A0S3QRE9_THET7|nr:cytochrome d ubiquinol oxidase subunit II [Thermosulfidibacter takaii]BAT70920.1 cytochrome d ubiquinol oxidase subunit II [Thermosulfidibacter takaii ABI70S6]
MHDTLRLIWFVLWGVLWIGYFVLDGFDLGAGILSLFAKDEEEKRFIYNAIGPFWDANEVWLITAGGATFAAFPKTYAVMFSGLYTPLLMLLFCLIFRGVAIEFRNKEEDPKWRRNWDIVFGVSSLLATLLLGVAFANLFKGLPIDDKGIFRGNFFSLLNPYGILGGILFILMSAVHGATWLSFRGYNGFEEKYRNLALQLWVPEVVVAMLFLGYSASVTDLWKNFSQHLVLYVFPAIAILGLLGIPLMLKLGNALAVWISSAVAVLGAASWGLAGLFPNLLKSSIDPAYSLTIYNSSSSKLTLLVMTVVALIFVPIMLVYKFWTYKTFATKLSKDAVYYEEAY